jgi:HEAT repeat protein
MPTTAELIETMRSSDGLARQKARIELEKIGKPAVDPLINLLVSGQGAEVWQAAKALQTIRDPQAASALVGALQRSDPGVRWLAAEGLVALGAQGLAPLLDALAHDPTSSNLREGAHHVLYDLISKNYLLEKYVVIAQPVLAALDGPEPAVAVPSAAHAGLEKLRNL